MRRYLILFVLLASCPGAKSPEGMVPTGLSVPDTPLTIRDSSELIGGPAAQGRVGDVLLSNDKIRVIIQKPAKNAGINSFGGTIIDAAHADRAAMGDQWGTLFPMVNVEWTVNYTDYVVTADGTDGGPKILQARGIIDTYDYIDVDWIADAAAGALNQQLAFADRFDDRRDPFQINEELRDLSTEVITEYRLDPGKNYVQIETTFTNPSDHPIRLPVGEFMVGRGELALLIPGIGFSPDPARQAGEATPAVLYTAFDDGDISYGYFFDPAPFGENKTTSLSYSGLTGVLLGEEFLKIFPVGSNVQPEIGFELEPQSQKTITRYFVVGNGDAGSVLDTGLGILKAVTAEVSGVVQDEGGSPVAGAVVAVKKPGAGTIATYRTDATGMFVGKLPTGEDKVGKLFGEGRYEVWVDKKGYHANTTSRAGNCEPAQIDLSGGASAFVTCILGQKGRVEITGGVVDAATGLKIPARLTIVGEDPSPETQGAGTFSDAVVFKRPFGIVDSLLINALGGIGLGNSNSFDLEPGNYLFVFSHGPEYSIAEREVTVAAGASVLLEGIELQRVVATPGFVSADFHIHALPSPDSAFGVERRALAAAADGLDVLQSSDHDFLTDYAPVVEKLSEEGILFWDSLATIVGNEITPNHYGHLHAFPLTTDLEDPDHGALDWSAHPLDVISPAPDYVMSPAQIVEAVLQDPGEEVIQINHISDNPTGLPVAAGWLTTPIYQEDFGTAAFTSLADPIERRLNVSGESLIFDQFSAMELAIGAMMKENKLWTSAIPTWFNLLNLGLMPTATGNSDSHHEIHMPLGLPRNYVASDVDPKDGFGSSYTEMDEEIYARRINERRVVVSAGPFISLHAVSEEGESAGVGEVVRGSRLDLDILVQAPEWAWFDTIEIYMNTEPLPAEDSGRFALKGEAASPQEFAKPYHVPHYVYQPSEVFRLSDGSLNDWKMENGKIEAKLKVGLSVTEDTWVVVVVRGTPQTEGYRSLFPIVPEVLKDESAPPSIFDPLNLTPFHLDRNVGAPAWAFTNPIFIDTDGDADGDGFPFEAKWVRAGISQLKPFRQ